jgi:tetratricopeptide (TPR) repeat protein
MAEAPRAIFISYASQDAEAAKRLCDALRAAGVAVWFDVEGGLETGDEWDAKIRRQIKECVLFLPVISANTQAREEGYFRIEWDLAAERARGIASGVPFILPIVIDDTREPEALVPDRFRSVQWTRARGGELTPDAVAKFAKLWSHRAGFAKAKAAAAAGETESVPVAAPAAAAVPAPARRASWWPLVLVGGVLAVGAAAYFIWSARSAPPVASPAPAVAAEVRPAFADYPRDPELRRARALLFTTDAIPDDFALAEDILKPFVAQRPNDPEVATVAAEVALEFLIRGFDLTPPRRSQVQRLTERAAQLAPDNPYAIAAVARYLLFIDAQRARAEELTRRAIALKPDEARFYRTLYTILTRTKPIAEVNAFEERMAAQFPRDPLVAYDIARRYKDENDLAQAEKWFDRTIAHESPPAFAFVWKAWIMLQVHGDLAATKEWLDRVPERQRVNARVVNARYVHALYSGDTGQALRALGEIADDWLTDFDFTGPKALLIGNLHLRNGRADLANVQLEAALALADAEIAKNPTDLFPRRAKMWVLISLGRLEEARAIYPVLLQATRRPYVLNFRTLSWTNTATAALLLGFRADAVTLLREAATDANARLVLRNLFQQDPRLAPWRDDAEIKALLADPASPVASAAAAPAAPARPATEAEQLAARALALTEKIGFTREDLTTAADIARRATEKEPENARAWGARAWVEAAWIMRGWDMRQPRREEAQTLANRALSLDPAQSDALYALSYVFSRQGAIEQAEAVLRKAIAAAPDNARIARTLGSLLQRQGRRDEAVTYLQSLTERFPRDPLIRYELALQQVHYGFAEFTTANFDEAAKQLDAAIALQPFASALLLRGIVAAVWHDDFATFRTCLTQLAELPLAERTEDRTVGISMWGFLVAGQYDQVTTIGGLTSRNYFEDAVLSYPAKSWLIALAAERVGKPNLARTHWDLAAELLRQRAAEAPSLLTRQVELAITLARLGQREEALALIAKVEPVWREELTRTRPFMLAQFYASLGDAPKAVEYLRLVVDRSVYSTRHVLRRDPWWDKIRESAEFRAMLANLGPQP